MTWHAIDAVDDAIGATRRFLFPFRLVRWTKLAVLVLLMGGGMSTNVSVPPFPRFETRSVPDVYPTIVADAGTTVLVALLVGIALIGVVLSVTSLSLRLVFYDALCTDTVRLWKPFKRRLRAAFGLFLFSVGVGLLLGGPFAIAAVANERSLLAFDGLPTVSLVALVFGGVALVVTTIVVLRLTYEFVVPVMVLRNDGVIAAWRRFWPTLRDSWTGFVVYAIVHFFLALGITIAEGVVMLVLGGTVAVLAAVVLIVLAGLLGGFSALTGTTIGLVALAGVVLVALLTLFVVLLPMRVLTRTYLITYEVSTLGGIDPELALLDSTIDPSADSSIDESGNRSTVSGEGRYDNMDDPTRAAAADAAVDSTGAEEPSAPSDDDSVSDPVEDDSGGGSSEEPPN